MAKNTINLISDASSRVAVAVLNANENAQMARHAWALLLHQTQAKTATNHAVLV